MRRLARRLCGPPCKNSDVHNTRRLSDDPVRTNNGEGIQTATMIKTLWLVRGILPVTTFSFLHLRRGSGGLFLFTLQTR
jgi:hypothetical protein